jgi:hypothetical protein
VYSCSGKKKISGQVSTCRIGPFPCKSCVCQKLFQLHWSHLIKRGMVEWKYLLDNNVMYIRIARHISARAKARDNKTSIARQRLGKHAYNTSCILCGPCRELIKCSKKRPSKVNREVKSRVSRRQPTGIWAWEQRNWSESSLRNWQLQNSGKKSITLWKEGSMCGLKLQRDCDKSVARIRLMKTEPSCVCNGEL